MKRYTLDDLRAWLNDDSETIPCLWFLQALDAAYPVSTTDAIMAAAAAMMEDDPQACVC